MKEEIENFNEELCVMPGLQLLSWQPISLVHVQQMVSWEMCWYDTWSRNDTRRKRFVMVLRHFYENFCIIRNKKKEKFTVSRSKKPVRTRSTNSPVVFLPQRFCLPLFQRKIVKLFSLTLPILNSAKKLVCRTTESDFHMFFYVFGVILLYRTCHFLFNNKRGQIKNRRILRLVIPFFSLLAEKPLSRVLFPSFPTKLG